MQYFVPKMFNFGMELVSLSIYLRIAGSHVLCELVGHVSFDDVKHMFHACYISPVVSVLVCSTR